MNNGSIENPFREKEAPKMGKRERVFTDEEVELLNNMVGAAGRILRNKGIGINHPEFQNYKREAVNIVFGLWSVSSPEDREKFWRPMAARTESLMKISPQEHFSKKRAKELKKNLGDPVDEKMQLMLDQARQEIVAKMKRKKADAQTIRDAVYRVVSLGNYRDRRAKEAAANELKYYLCIENSISTSDPSLKSTSDPSRQKNIFRAA